MRLLFLMAALSWGAQAPNGRKPVPTIAPGPYVEVLSYRIPGYKKPVAPFILDGLMTMRSHQEGDDAVVEAKVTGRTLGDLGASVRRMLRFVKMLSKDAKVSEKVVLPAMRLVGYRQQYGDGWPDDQPPAVKPASPPSQGSIVR